MNKFFSIIRHSGGKACYSIEHSHGPHYQARLLKSTTEEPLPDVIDLSIHNTHEQDAITSKLISAIVRVERDNDEVN